MSQTRVMIHGITSMIVSGRIAAGPRFPIEADLAASSGVPPSSVREGVRALAILRVLEARQGAEG